MKIRWLNLVRIYGLFLVLGYHLFYQWLPGGFLGVDVFFTFSGFLITTVILSEFSRKNDFALFDFYKRRILRIMIPLVCVIIFTIPFLLLVSPDFSANIKREAAAALGLVTNWYEIKNGNSYESRLLPSIYLHTWTLAVQMQFYLLWGLVCAGLAWLSKVRVVGLKYSVAVVSFVFAAGSYWYMQNMYMAGISLDTIYFNSFTRGFAFFIGSFAAALSDGIADSKTDSMPCGTEEKCNGVKRGKLAVSALIAVFVSVTVVILYGAVRFRFTDEIVFRYGFLAASLLTVVLIFTAKTLHYLTKANEPKIVTVVADISYQTYLFHWPLYIVFSALIFNHLSAALITLVFTFIFAAVLYYGIERKFVLEKGMLVKVSASVCLLIALTLSTMVIYRAPVITSIEENFMLSYIRQDVNSITVLARRVRETEAQEKLSKVTEHSLVATLSEEREHSVVSALSAMEELSAEEVSVDVEEFVPEENVPDIGIAGGVIIIGDSVALGASMAIEKFIPDSDINADIGRHVWHGVGLITETQELGEMREYVVIALGTNGTNNFKAHFDEMIEVLNPGHKLILVTPFDGRGNANAKSVEAIAEYIHELAELFDFVTVADWNKVIGARVELLSSDKVHLRAAKSEGADLYAQCLVDALNEASTKPGKR